MTHKEYVQNYITRINKRLNNHFYPEIKGAELYRYPLFCNAVEQTILIWEDLFNILDDKEKQYYILYAYAMLLNEDISTRNLEVKPKDYVMLSTNPNEFCREVFHQMGEKFCFFEEMEKSIYNKKQKLFPFPDPRGTYFKIGDEVRGHIIRYKVIDIFPEGEEIMVKLQSVHDHGSPNVFVLTERDMINEYYITAPVEYQKESTER